jgi:hypothetical protein
MCVANPTWSPKALESDVPAGAQEAVSGHPARPGDAAQRFALCFTIEVTAKPGFGPTGFVNHALTPNPMKYDEAKVSLTTRNPSELRYWEIVVPPFDPQVLPLVMPSVLANMYPTTLWSITDAVP